MTKVIVVILVIVVIILIIVIMVGLGLGPQKRDPKKKVLGLKKIYLNHQHHP